MPARAHQSCATSSSLRPNSGSFGSTLLHPAEPEAGDPADARIAGNVKEGAVDPVHVLGNVFDHQHMSGEIGLPGRSDQMAENGEVEGCVRQPRRDAWFERGALAVDEPAQCAQDGRLAAVAQDVRRHGTVGDMLEALP